jgi:hypothetical protein
MYKIAHASRGLSGTEFLSKQHLRQRWWSILTRRVARRLLVFAIPGKRSAGVGDREMRVLPPALLRKGVLRC